MHRAVSSRSSCMRIDAVVGEKFLSACSPWIVRTAFVHHHRERHNILRFLGVVRANRMRPDKHWNQLFRAERGRLFIKVLGLDEMEFKKTQDKLTTERIRDIRRKMRLSPDYEYQYREGDFAPETSGLIAKEYEPPENREFSTLADRFGSAVTNLPQKTRKVFGQDRSIQKVKGNEKFSSQRFAETEALELFKNVNLALVERNPEKLLENATERAAKILWPELKRKSIVWRLVEEMEPPEAVNVVLVQNNEYPFRFGQVTVRFVTKQSLAVYDRFGRLIQGSETSCPQLTEYVVYEKALDAPNGKWRVHGKIPSRLNQAPPPLLNTLPKLADAKNKSSVPVAQEIPDAAAST